MSRLGVVAQERDVGHVGAPFYALWFLVVYSRWAISIYFMIVSHVVFSCIAVAVLRPSAVRLLSVLRLSVLAPSCILFSH